MMNILNLPDEVLLKIFSYMDHEKIIEVSNVCQRFNNISADSTLNSVLNLQNYKQSDEDSICKFLKNKSRSRKIISLNVNNVYWAKVPTVLTHLKNLECLKILNVPITFKQFRDIMASTQLKDVSISWLRDVWDDKRATWTEMFDKEKHLFEKLEKFHLQMWASVSCAYYMLSLCCNLERLVLTEKETFNSYKGFIAYPRTLNLPRLKEMILDSVNNVSLSVVSNESSDFKNQIKVYWLNSPVLTSVDHSRLSTAEVLFLRLNPDSLHLIENITSFPNLKDFNLVATFPIRYNVMKLIEKAPSLTKFALLQTCNRCLNIKRLCENVPNLESLAFCCQPEVIKLDVCSSIANLKNLTRLSIPCCVLSEVFDTSHETENTKSVVYTNNFKRRRITNVKDSSDSSGRAVFNKVLDQCFKLKLLEIGILDMNICSCPDKINWECLENIHKLKNLTHLTLKDIPITNGNFFIQMCKECTKLEFIRLIGLGPSGLCVYNQSLAEGIVHCKNLTALKIDQNYIFDANNLIASLIHCKKLERLYMLCRTTCKGFNPAVLLNLIDSHPKLSAVLLISSTFSSDFCTSVRKKYEQPKYRPLVVRLYQFEERVMVDSRGGYKLIIYEYFKDLLSEKSWFSYFYKDYL